MASTAAASTPGPKLRKLLSVGVLGSGAVATTLAAAFATLGHGVTVGSRDASKLAAFAKDHPKVKLASIADTAKASDVIVLAVKGTAAVEVLTGVRDHVKGKLVIDTTNPVADDRPPRDGVLEFFTRDKGLLELLQEAVPEAKLVKAFNSVGNKFMFNPAPAFGGVRPTMFICGDDADAKAQTAAILDEFGWDAEDMGKAHLSVPIEALCQLWCARGFNGIGWAHAFKLLKA